MCQVTTIKDIHEDIESFGGLIISNQGGILDNFNACVNACESLGIDPPCDNPDALDALDIRVEGIDSMIMDINDVIMGSGLLLMYHPDDPGTLIIVSSDNPEWLDA